MSEHTNHPEVISGGLIAKVISHLKSIRAYGLVAEVERMQRQRAAFLIERDSLSAENSRLKRIVELREGQVSDLLEDSASTEQESVAGLPMTGEIKKSLTSDSRQAELKRGLSRDYNQMSVDRERLHLALTDLLNDCINFDGGKLSDCILKQASDTLAEVGPLLIHSVESEQTFKVGGRCTKHDVLDCLECSVECLSNLAEKGQEGK